MVKKWRQDTVSLVMEFTRYYHQYEGIAKHVKHGFTWEAAARV